MHIKILTFNWPFSLRLYTLKAVSNSYRRSAKSFRKAIALSWALAKMSQLSALLSEARVTADDTSQDEQDFIQVQNRRKRFRNQNERNSISEPVRPRVITINPRRTQVHFATAMKTIFPQLKIQRIRELSISSDFFIQPENKASRDILMSNPNLQQVFPNANVTTRNTLPKATSKPSFVIVNVHHSIQENEIKEELLSNNGMNEVKVSGIIGRASGKPTKIIRVITDSTNHVFAAQKHGVKIGHSAIECKNEQRCLLCSGQHTVKQCAEPKENDKCANCGGSPASVYKGCSSYQNAIFEATKRKQDIKYSAVAKRQTEMLQANSTVSAKTISVLVAEVLSKIRSTFNTMSYSDIRYVVSISASRFFGNKIEGQKVLDSIKNANKNFTKVPTQQISTNNHQFGQHGENYAMELPRLIQWNITTSRIFEGKRYWYRVPEWSQELAKRKSKW